MGSNKNNTFMKYLKNKEKCWEQYIDKSGDLRYMVITKNAYMDKYILIEIRNNERKEIAKSDNPILLRDKIPKEVISF